MLYILWGSKGDKWKIVCSLSETVSTMLLAAWEAMRPRVGDYRIWKTRRKIPGGTDPVSRPYIFRGRDSSKNPIIFTYNCYIRILLIKTNPIIYICYIFCKGGVEICVLTVRGNEHDSEHGVGDDEVTCRMLPRVRQHGNDREQLSDAEPDLRRPGNRWK
jgi:hypothetical protein